MTKINSDKDTSFAQKALNTLTGSKLDVDGKFGPKTQAALRKFQEENGLAETGRLNPTTLQALQGLLKQKAPDLFTQALTNCTFGTLSPKAKDDVRSSNASVSAGGAFRIGSRGEAVIEIQKLLCQRGFDVEVDGKFGAKTAEAVKKFQENQKITVDGLVGRETLERLGKPTGTLALAAPAAKPIDFFNLPSKRA